MNWRGKLVGGAVGLMLGGPAGALLGMAFGHAVDEGETTSSSSPSARRESPDRHYAVLQCRPSDTCETIKHQYRKLVRTYHPDAIAAKGLPEDFTRFAQERFNEIQEAYAAVKKEKGML